MESQKAFKTAYKLSLHGIKLKISISKTQRHKLDLKNFTINKVAGIQRSKLSNPKRPQFCMFHLIV